MHVQMITYLLEGTNSQLAWYHFLFFLRSADVVNICSALAAGMYANGEIGLAAIPADILVRQQEFADLRVVRERRRNLEKEKERLEGCRKGEWKTVRAKEREKQTKDKEGGREKREIEKRGKRARKICNEIETLTETQIES